MSPNRPRSYGPEINCLKNQTVTGADASLIVCMCYVIRAY